MGLNFFTIKVWNEKDATIFKKNDFNIFNPGVSYLKKNFKGLVMR